MGKIIVILGPMGAGKTSELLRYIERGEVAGQSMALYKFSKDTRYSSTFLSTHSGRNSTASAILVDSLAGAPCPDADLICVDEAQFIEGCGEWAGRCATRSTVVLSVLSSDAWQKPFPSFGEIVAGADEIVQLRAICYKCKRDAIFTEKCAGNSQRIEIGGFDIYRPVCRQCR